MFKGLKEFIKKGFNDMHIRIRMVDESLKELKKVVEKNQSWLDVYYKELCEEKKKHEKEKRSLEYEYQQKTSELKHELDVFKAIVLRVYENNPIPNVYVGDVRDAGYYDVDCRLTKDTYYYQVGMVKK